MDARVWRDESDAHVSHEPYVRRDGIRLDAWSYRRTEWRAEEVGMRRSGQDTNDTLSKQQRYKHAYKRQHTDMRVEQCGRIWGIRGRVMVGAQGTQEDRRALGRLKICRCQRLPADDVPIRRGGDVMMMRRQRHPRLTMQGAKEWRRQQQHDQPPGADREPTPKRGCSPVKSSLVRTYRPDGRTSLHGCLPVQQSYACIVHRRGDGRQTDTNVCVNHTL